MLKKEKLINFESSLQKRSSTSNWKVPSKAMFKSGKAYEPIPNNIFFEQVIACLNEGKNIAMYVQGNSMFPFLCHGDKILLVPGAKSQRWKIGDIVLANTQIGIILHRIIKIQENLIVLAGDGNTKQTEHSFPNEVFGKVVKVYRGKSAWEVSSIKSRLIWQCWHIFRPIRRILLVFIKQLTSITQAHYEDKR